MFAELIREQRTLRNWSQSYLATLVNVSENQIAQWERGKANPKPFMENKVKQLFADCPPEECLRREEVLVQAPQPAKAEEPVSDALIRKFDAFLAAMAAKEDDLDGPPAPLPPQFQRGNFVVFSREGLRIPGKVVNDTGVEVEVEVFHFDGVPSTTTVVVPHAEVAKLEIPLQTPVFLWDERQCVPGRLVAVEAGGLRLQLGPQSLVSTPLSNVYVRSPEDRGDPTCLLACQATEAAPFRVFRRRLNHFLAQQRSGYRGITALATARIDLLPHQLQAVKRVLSDPIQRYMLADEVGLGKTIEAGLLVAQHLIEEGKGASVLILTPRNLVAQWGRELASSFGIRPGDPRITIREYGWLAGAWQNAAEAPEPTLVVVDEAHRSADWAFAEPGSQHFRTYERLEELSRCPKILLLSGTPLRHNESGFLAMLHLLDPAAYDLADREGFLQRVAVRKTVAEALMELTEDFEPIFLEDTLLRLRLEAEGDTELARLVETVLARLNGPMSVAQSAVEELRAYLTERYSLDHRIIRAHRDMPQIAHVLPERMGLTLIENPVDPTLREIADHALEDWRTRTLDHGGATRPSADVFLRLVSDAISHPVQLVRSFNKRAEDLRLARQAACFPGEAEWLERTSGGLLQEAERSPDERFAALEACLTERFQGERVVVLIDAPDTADALWRHLARHPALAPRLLRLGRDNARQVRNFEQVADMILLCDRNADEGLNLQRRSARILFFDFPINFGRMEQRIGRFDRLDGMEQLRFYALNPIGAFERPWVAILNEQVNLFQRSSARLQFWLKEQMLAFQLDLLQEGPQEAFAKLAGTLASPDKGVDAELRQARRDEALASEAHPFDVQEFMESVLATRRVTVAETREIVEGCLRTVNYAQRTAFRKTHFIHQWTHLAAPSTVIPLPHRDSLLALWQDERVSERFPRRHRIAFGPFTFDPEDKDESVSLLGLGHPFFDHILDFMAEDDRSRAWALWRLDASKTEPEVYLCFDYWLEADLAAARPIVAAWKTLPSIQRRVDEFLPIRTGTLWFNQEGESVEDPQILARLERTPSGQDRYLSTGSWTSANRTLPVLDWKRTVDLTRLAFEDRLRQDTGLLQTCASAEARLLRASEQSLRVLRSRAIHAPEGLRATLLQAMAVEAELTQALRTGIRTPVIRVDSIGAVVLAPGLLP